MTTPLAPARKALTAAGRSPVTGPFLIMFLVAIGAALTTPRFANGGNLRNLGLEVAIVSIVAIGSTFVILTAQIDLSPGAVIAVTSIVTAVLLKNSGFGLGATLVMVIVMGVVIGLVNGFFCSYGRIPSFIFTLAAMSAYQGLAYLITGGTPIFSLPGLGKIFYGSLGVVPYPFVYVVVLYALAWAYLRYSRGGRKIYAVGGNEAAARLAGIKVNRVRTRAFVFAGVLSAIAGLLMTAQLDSGAPNYGSGMELTGIAAAVIGGTSLFGGRGNVVATFFGAMIITIVQNALNLHAVGTAWQGITLGVIIVVAVGIDMWRSAAGHAVLDRVQALAVTMGLSRPSPEMPTDAGGTENAPDETERKDQVPPGPRQ
ncbi:MAG: ABC transporter permease [Streptosporangiaceae bacterium]